MTLNFDPIIVQDLILTAEPIVTNWVMEAAILHRIAPRTLTEEPMWKTPNTDRELPTASLPVILALEPTLM